MLNVNLCDKPIVIDTWQQDEVYNGMFPKGTRDKSAYFSSDKPEDGCIKPNWRYLFKLSRTTPTVNFPWQFWCEIVAYRLGLLMGVAVPPAHIGFSRNYTQGQDTYGALIEWFYDDREDEYIDGGQFMINFVKDYDREKGTQHNFLVIATNLFNIVFDSPKHWAGVFTLDCLIGNIDRHQDNWGLILRGGKLRAVPSENIFFSPAFDNGTALGYEIPENKLGNFDNPQKFQKYLTHRKAHHHMRWSLDKSEAFSFYGFMQKFALEFPDAKGIIAKHLSFDRSQVEEILSPLVKAVSDAIYSLSKKRLDFMIELIFRRKELLKQSLNL